MGKWSDHLNFKNARVDVTKDYWHGYVLHIGTHHFDMTDEEAAYLLKRLTFQINKAATKENRDGNHHNH